MDEVRKADPAARRQALLVIVSAAAIGGLLIAGFEPIRELFREWLSSEPADAARRAKLALYVAAFILCVPLAAFAIYLWWLGARVLRAQQFPPPGFRVIRDTPVLGGSGATARGHVMQILAVCLGASAALLWLFFVWLARTIGEGAA